LEYGIVDERTNAAVVSAAQAGDERALDALVAQYLPLVYNLVGRALDGHSDVDDVVQETMLRALHGIDALRDPTRFRSWLVTIAMRQINDRWRARQHGPAPLPQDLPDPGADFVDLTITRLGLSGERREVAEATAWLDDELSRADLTAALHISPAHAAVRVQRMKNQLAASRGVVRALAHRPRCPELAEIVERWDGRPDALWRKRIARHTRNCETCGVRGTRLIPAEALLAGIGMVPPPTSVAVHSASTVAPAAAGWLVRIVKPLLVKPVAAVAFGAVAVTGAGVVYVVYPKPHPVTHVILPSPQPSTAAAPTTSSSSPIATAAPTTSTFTPASVYGSVVDSAESAPSKLQKPGALPVRPVGTPLAVTGLYEAPKNNTVIYQLNHRGDYLTVRGEGYFRIRWQIVYTAGRVGVIAMPSWTGLTGKLFHVASGGGRRMDDVLGSSGTNVSTGMGSTATGFDSVPAGAQQMWQNEYYYLDGTVVLHQNQGWAEAGFIVQDMSWQQVSDDVHMTPGNPSWVLRYGVIRDTGTDTAPVPQYVTRAEPTDPATVSQKSVVS
jgi:RNA polymerase sigma factor (sigma-70 family)